MVRQRHLPLDQLHIACEKVQKALQWRKCKNYAKLLFFGQTKQPILNTFWTNTNHIIVYLDVKRKKTNDLEENECHKQEATSIEYRKQSVIARRFL